VFVRYSAGGQASLDCGDLPEVETWYATLKSKNKAMADRAFDRLAEQGPLVADASCQAARRRPVQLRFTCEGTARRVTYTIDVQRRIITLTTFRKQRQNERQEVARARQAMRASQQAGGRDG
jgi:hypothetical protein